MRGSKYCSYNLPQQMLSSGRLQGKLIVRPMSLEIRSWILLLQKTVGTFARCIPTQPFAIENNYWRLGTSADTIWTSWTISDCWRASLAWKKLRRTLPSRYQIFPLLPKRLQSRWSTLKVSSNHYLLRNDFPLRNVPSTDSFDGFSNYLVYGRDGVPAN
jgi:hypothetical protein